MTKEKLERLIILAIVLALALTGGGLYVFRSSLPQPLHDGLVDIYNNQFEMRISNKARQFKREILRDIPELSDASSSEFEKTCLLRDWAYGHLMYAAEAETQTVFDYWVGERDAAYNFTVLTDAYKNYDGGGYCWGCAAYLSALLATFGFDAVTLDMKLPGANATHAVTLVYLPGNGWIIQDATYNMTYVDETGKPITVQDLMTMLKSGNMDGYRHQFGETRLRYTTMSHEFGGETSDTVYQPETQNYYPFYSTRPIVLCDERYVYLIDMRQPGAFEWQIMESLEKTLEPMGYPPKGEYLYLFPVAITVNYAERADGLLAELQRLATT